MGDSDEAKVHVGNISYSVTEGDLKDKFEEIGAVAHVNIIKDRDTGRSKGFGFVTFEDCNSAKQAIDTLNQADLCGRCISVNKPRPQSDNRRGGGGGGGGNRGGGGGFGGGGGGYGASGGGGFRGNYTGGY